MQERRALGLCYNCDEKFILGHKCSTSRFVLVLDDTKPFFEVLEDPIDPIHHANMVHFHLSPHLYKNFFAQTLKF